jgi:hypothetical protein
MGDMTLGTHTLMERRALPRVRTAMPVSFCVVNPDVADARLPEGTDGVCTTTHDISAAGLSLYSQLPVASGELVSLCLHSGGQVVQGYAASRWCRPVAGAAEGASALFQVGLRILAWSGNDPPVLEPVLESCSPSPA